VSDFSNFSIFSTFRLVPGGQQLEVARNCISFARAQQRMGLDPGIRTCV
jgi:hypothetical protein